MFYNKHENADVVPRLRLKICGITRLEDALLAVKFGADALGFVFYEKSPRYISPANAHKIIEQLPPFITMVGLFVNPSQMFINTALEACSLDIIQFHGDETPAFCSAQHRRVIKALPISEAKDLECLSEYNCSVLLDAKAPEGVYGGTGQSFDWSLLQGLEYKHPVLLAGGLQAENIGDAMKVEGVYALDVSSGVESTKGIKDKEKMKVLCEKFYHGL
ncbi:MAG: phosphoribosylanthranilate isomerase [Ghiorsea sp.]|nr:phosphoribosylanthranilate isomerase [Ghiorsea sp.]